MANMGSMGVVEVVEDGKEVVEEDEKDGEESNEEEAKEEELEDDDGDIVSSLCVAHVRAPGVSNSDVRVAIQIVSTHGTYVSPAEINYSRERDNRRMADRHSSSG
eukprot:m.92934 g.92934  ORF g.92934 m.92934 type:complete len:105 (-) comp20256_c0_seq1:143-457(-)